MRITEQSALRRLADQSLTVAAVLIARLRRGRSSREVEARLRALPGQDRIVVVGATLGVLLLVALLAAQGGILGMAAFFAAVILLVR